MVNFLKLSGDVVGTAAELVELNALDLSDRETRWETIVRDFRDQEFSC